MEGAQWVWNAMLRKWDLSWRWWASCEGPTHENDMFTAVFERGQVTEEGGGGGWKRED